MERHIRRAKIFILKLLQLRPCLNIDTDVVVVVPEKLYKSLTNQFKGIELTVADKVNVRNL
jgi:hypothetical protein